MRDGRHHLAAVLATQGVTGREAEVLEALTGFHTNAEIAGALHISVRTVESHVSSLPAKLGVASRKSLMGERHTRCPGAHDEVVGLECPCHRRNAAPR